MQIVKVNGLKKIIGSIENAMIFEYITDEPVLSKMYIYNANFSIWLITSEFACPIKYK